LIEFRFRPGWHLQTASVFLAPFFICFAQSGDTNLAASLQALRSAIQARDLPSIEQQRKELLRAAPRNREAHGTAGQYLADARYCAAAKEEFEIAMSLGVSEAQQAGSHYLLGQCYERISQVARADAEYRQAVNINPGQEKFHFALISLLASQWETGLGEDAARAALARFPASARIWAAAGLVELKNGSFQSALEDWRHASALQPDLPLVIKLLGRIQMSLSRYDEAVQNFTKAVKLDPSDAQAWFFTGLAYLKVDNDGDRALDAFLRAIELNPDPAEGYYWAGSSDMQRKHESRQAIHYLEEAVSRAPAWGPANQLLIQAYRSTGQDEKAAAAARKFRTLSLQEHAASEPVLH